MGTLTAMSVQRMKTPGRFSDGGGLYLRISNSGSKYWIFRYTRDGKPREMGLGPIEVIGLVEAREQAIECRRKLHTGVDPLNHREAHKKTSALEAAKIITFDQCADEYINAHSAGWRNAKHIEQWRSSIKQYVSPLLGSLPVHNVDTAMVLKVLQPIWYTKTETASRIRGRIERIIDSAKTSGFFTGENPARWRGHLAAKLPKRSKVQKTKHFPALNINEMGAFIAKLRRHTGISFKALEFLILTATRTSETLGAKWSEISFDEHEKMWLWTIPEERMKARVEHRVPLSDAAIEVINYMREFQESEYIFPGAKRGKPLSNMSLLEIMRGMGHKAVPHGFRSTFRDWAAERTNFSRDAAEKALAHTVKDKVEAAYRRGDLLKKRKPLMDAWAKFCATESVVGTVIGIKERVAK